MFEPIRPSPIIPSFIFVSLSSIVFWLPEVPDDAGRNADTAAPADSPNHS